MYIHILSLICLVFIPQKFLTKEAVILVMTLVAVEMMKMMMKMKTWQLETVFKIFIKCHMLYHILIEK